MKNKKQQQSITILTTTKHIYNVITTTTITKLLINIDNKNEIEKYKIDKNG